MARNKEEVYIHIGGGALGLGGAPSDWDLATVDTSPAVSAEYKICAMRAAQARTARA